MEPITSIPTSKPLATGMILSLEISTVASSSLDDVQIIELLDTVAESYGVSQEDLDSVAQYVTSGTIIANIPDEMSENEALEALTASIADVKYDITGTIEVLTDGNVSDDELILTLQNSVAESLNVNVSDVSIEIDSDGVAKYTISSANVEEANALQEILQDGSTNEAISMQVSDVIPVISAVSNHNFHVLKSINFRMNT